MILHELNQLLEAKKTHDQCSDEIDEYHADTRDAMELLAKTELSAEQKELLKAAQEHLHWR